ncbi:hypothetical protein BH23GEM2_BH23GEM2_23390 [soil metagenome]
MLNGRRRVSGLLGIGGGVLAMLCSASGLQAQWPAASPLNVGTSEDVERWRLATLADTALAPSLFMRSTSSLGIPGRGVELLGAELAVVHNSALPFGPNRGALWAGRGANASAGTAMALTAGPLRLILAPQLVYSENQFIARDSARFYQPDRPPDRSPYAVVWYVNGPYSADVPIRFGGRPIRRWTPGQSSLTLSAMNTSVGVGTENHWWGPGFRNALILSNNAEGFPHAFIRSALPWRTPLGAVEFRWIVGGLTESQYFDADPDNDLRSLSAAIVTLEPWRARNLTVGLARAVMGTSTGWSEIAGRWLEVLHDAGRPNNVSVSDSALSPGGREQVFSYFGRLRLPKSGFEVHGEVGFTESPRSLRDLILTPTHTRAYTIGMQWRSSPDQSFWRVQSEVTTVEQGSSFRDRPLGVWYTSRRVIQGYTNRGQPLGAAVGPGSSGQWLAVDRFSARTRFGLYAGRSRHNEDVRSIYAFPDYQSYCNRDVNTYVGATTSAETRFGRISVDATLGNRINLWFQMGSGCPGGDAQIDVRNRTLSFTFEPLRRRAPAGSPR